MISLLGIYRPRRTPLHLAPAWLKMLLLLTLSIASVMTSDPVTSLGVMVACLLLLVSTAPPVKATLKGMGVIALIAVFTTLFQVWRGDYARAIDLAGDLIAIAALALAVTSSTSMAAMLDLVATMAKPLRRIVPPDTIGVTVALALRSIPEAARILTEARVAARARGMDRNLRAVAVPAASRSVGFALQLGQALHARGIAESGHAYRIDRDLDTNAMTDAAATHGLGEPPVRDADHGGFADSTTNPRAADVTDSTDSGRTDGSSQG